MTYVGEVVNVKGGISRSIWDAEGIHETNITCPRDIHLIPRQCSEIFQSIVGRTREKIRQLTISESLRRGQGV